MSFFTTLASGFGNLVQGATQLSNARNSQQQARINDIKALREYSKIKSYKMDDLYKPLTLGSGRDNATRYKAGNDLSVSFLKNSAYEDLGKSVSDKNSSLGSGFREERKHILNLVRNGLTKSDDAQLKKILSDQRKQARVLGNTVVQKAIESGSNPYRAKLSQLLIANQQAAENANKAGLGMAIKSGERRMAGIGMLQDSLANEYRRAAKIADAKDGISRYNTDIENQKRLNNWQRGNQISDKNVQLHNDLSRYNNTNYTKARRNVIDSENQKKMMFGDYFSGEASHLKKDAWNRGVRGQAHLEKSLKDFSFLF